MTQRPYIICTMTSNITDNISSKFGMSLHLQKFHPLEIIKNIIYQIIDELDDGFIKFDNLDKIVTIQDNFDNLLIPKNHPARSRSDTYYIDDNNVLRTHTSAHQTSLLKQGYTKFLVTGDVYRKDEIDRNHYPVFHQMEGLCIINDCTDSETIKTKLLEFLTSIIGRLFPDCEIRINDDYFPFTNPSYEIEVKFQGKWLEVLGCGIVQKQILNECGFDDTNGAWAFGLGLERLAMILFDIPDIRYFWCQDDAFLSQFKSYDIVKFKPYPLLKSLTKDISFWVNNVDKISNKDADWNWELENDFFELCREIGNMIEGVELFDKFYNSKKDSYSHAYHITYSCLDTSLKNAAEFNAQVNALHDQLSKLVANKLNLTLR